MTTELQTGQIRPAEAGDLESVLTLLAEVHLPAAGVREHLQQFLVLEAGGRIDGVVGLEVYGSHALLRSLAVSPGRQRRGDGHRLFQAILERARNLGVEEVYLLTETAATFFETRGFRKISREEVPEAVRTSVEFTSCCPVSAVCMRMQGASQARGESST